MVWYVKISSGKKGKEVLIAFLLLSIYIDHLPNLYQIIIIHILPTKDHPVAVVSHGSKKIDLYSQMLGFQKQIARLKKE
jgi:hypothetical protein